MSTSEPDRLRTPPRERFSGDTKIFDTQRIFDELADEPKGDIGGHRQITLFKSGNFSVVAFLFEQGARLPEHQADGIATIQVIEGRVEVATPEDHHAVGEDGLLILRPGITHDVEAVEPTKMLLHVHLRKPSEEVEAPK